MAISKRISIPIYDCDLYLYLADTMKQSLDSMKVKHKELVDEQDMNCQGVSYARHPDYIICLATESINPGIVHHEIGHVARSLLNDVGFNIRADNDEPLAYLEGWISNKVNQFLELCSHSS